MRWIAVLCLVLVSLAPARAQKHPAPFPEQFEIGRHTFFDFGPPSDFYELLIVRPNSQGASVERILLTPPADACYAPAKVETSSASLGESVSALLGKTNPCSIPDKDLRRELKRCKKCMVFSGVNVPCGANSRLIRSDILDRDMFAAAPNTPEHTSWTVQLLKLLDQALGPGVMDKPMFALPEDAHSFKANLDPLLQQELEAGKYDELFPIASQKASELFRAAQVNHPPPDITLLSSVPFRPQEFVLPEYPPLARMAHIHGNVSFKLKVDTDGHPDTPIFVEGHPLLLEAVKKAVAGWTFPTDAAGQEIQATIAFALNCSNLAK